MDPEQDLNEDNFLNEEEKAGIDKLRKELDCSNEEKTDEVLKKAIRKIQQLSKEKNEMNMVQKMEADR